MPNIINLYMIILILIIIILMYGVNNIAYILTDLLPKYIRVKFKIVIINVKILYLKMKYNIDSWFGKILQHIAPYDCDNFKFDTIESDKEFEELLTTAENFKFTDNDQLVYYIHERIEVSPEVICNRCTFNTVVYTDYDTALKIASAIYDKEIQHALDTGCQIIRTWNTGNNGLYQFRTNGGVVYTCKVRPRYITADPDSDTDII